MKRFIFLTTFLSVFSITVFSQTNEPKKFEILPCSPKLTESGRTASFRFNYRYIVLTDNESNVEKVTYLKSEYNYESYADSTEVIPCLKKLKLSPSSRYIVTISFGTTGGDNFILITLYKRESIKIFL